MINNFYGVITSFLKEFQKEGIERLTNEFKIMENNFHKSVDTTTWHVKGIRDRRLWTPLGDITISRRIYERYPRNGVQRILFDEVIGLEKYLYIQSCFFEMFINSINKVSSYKSLSEIFGSEFSTTTISKMLKESELFLEPKKLRDKTKLLFVNLDDIFVKQHKNKKYAYRMAVAYTGSIAVGNKDRKKLVQRTLISINTSLSTSQQVEELERVLMNVYGEIGKIIIVGDGASWISSYKNYFANIVVERYIDKFHYKKYVKDLLGKNIKIDWEYFKTLKSKNIEFYLLSLIADKNGEINHSKNQLKNLPKIKRYFKSFIKVSEMNYPNCIEGIQSHFVASMLKTRRSFSKDVAMKIMSINIAQYNNWNISTNKNNGIKLKNLGKVNVIIDSLTSYEFSNMPLLNSHHKETVAIFNNIVHGLK